MRLLDLLRLRIRSLRHRAKVERELDDELRFHLDELARQLAARGLDAGEARAEALRRFGGVAQIQERCRDTRGTRWLEDFAGDIRYALRLMAKSPGFTAVVLLSLALGIGANTAIFTLVEAVVLRELPVRDPERLVQIVGAVPGRDAAQGSFSHPSFEWLRGRTPIFSHLFTWNSKRLEAGQAESMEWVAVERVSADYFAGLGVVPALGRSLAGERHQPAVAVLSHHWWRGKFNADAAVLGRTVRLGGVPFTIVGVAPEGFHGPVVGARPDVFVPLASLPLTDPGSEALTSRNWSWLPLMARLAPAFSREQAAAALEPLWAGMVQETGPVARDGGVSKWFRELKVDVRPASTGISHLRRSFRHPLWVLAVVAGIVLLIACVNLSNFFLARSLARQREIALRLALGARRGRLLRQMLTESLLLAASGAALGLFFALWSSRALVSLLSTERDNLSLDIRLNLPLLSYTLLIAGLTALLFGLLPALRALRSTVHTVLKEGSPQVAGQQTASRSLLVVQVALSLLLVTGAALFLRTFRNLLSVELGFDAGRILVATVDPVRAGLKNEAAAQFLNALRDRLQLMPGAESVSLALMTPIQSCCWWDTLSVEGYTPVPGESVDVYLNSVAPGFFRTMGIRLLKGRDFDSRDVFTSRPVAIVSESFAKKYFPKGEAMGRSVALPPGYKVSSMEIVGVVADARIIDLRGPVRLAAYFPLAQSREGIASIELLVRTSGPPLALAAAVREQVHSFSPAIPVRFRTLEQEVESVLTHERVLALISGFFGAIALALAAIGLYGTISYSVVRRTSEIGVRVALGASRADVLWLIVRQCLELLFAGLAIGCAVALYLARLVESLLFGVQSADPLTFVLAAGVLSAVALLSAWLPARRAAAIHPMRALRYE